MEDGQHCEYFFRLIRVDQGRPVLLSAALVLQFVPAAGKSFENGGIAGNGGNFMIQPE
ncbi:hypothetical protein [Nitrosospira sp. NpAV]|uniref:hypothetical protein n=1 Tax=Nitrosospira sp. NpAV TaxID=58133 RepID=UPI000A6E7C56|nr:hypothetical protein [Nitrosospira sp. NpAV]